MEYKGRVRDLERSLDERLEVNKLLTVSIMEISEVLTTIKDDLGKLATMLEGADPQVVDLFRPTLEGLFPTLVVSQEAGAPPSPLPVGGRTPPGGTEETDTVKKTFSASPLGMRLLRAALTGVPADSFEDVLLRTYGEDYGNTTIKIPMGAGQGAEEAHLLEPEAKKYLRSQLRSVWQSLEFVWQGGKPAKEGTLPPHPRLRSLSDEFNLKTQKEELRQRLRNYGVEIPEPES